MKSAHDLSARLSELHKTTYETPLFNPVFQLSLEISRALENGQIKLSDLGTIISEMEDQSLSARAERLRYSLGQIDPDANRQEIGNLGDKQDFDAYRAACEHPKLHAVFTAHPTFLLAPDQSEAVAKAASSSGALPPDCCQAGSKRPAITLQYEHGRAMDAIANAQDARDVITAQMLGQARQNWPDKWHQIAPLPFRFASWVGYDMDGRTDIAWHDSIGFRLAEKAQRLERYCTALETIDHAHDLLPHLRKAAQYARAREADFAQDLSSPAALSQAANRLTQDDPDKLLSLSPLIAQLEEEARNIDRQSADQGSAKTGSAIKGSTDKGSTDTGNPNTIPPIAASDHNGNAQSPRAVQLKTLAASMRADGLGMGWIHFRVNSSQLHNAIRPRVDPDNLLDLSSKGAMARLRELLNQVQPLQANFAALAIESSTAIRQFLAMAQIQKHIDSDAPIRMLIAECEQPSTILAALYFARLFGIEDKVDISPLFETETALEHGGRFLDALLSETAYKNYAKKRGRVAIQTGFSDAGRFVGQIPASLAIERLQGRLAQAMAANDLTDVAALIFNTHGESMGRGAHPGGFSDRLSWPLSPWARRRFARAGIELEAEVSFQGGDGYLHFASPQLALATLTRITALQATFCDVDAPTDPFYRRTDLSLDFYRAVRAHQNDHLESATYSRALTAFGLGLLNSTGSRVSRRQSDLNADRDMNLRQIRAIPHNAILQQLGYPVNVIAGVGSAADGNFEEIAGLFAESERGRQLIRLVRSANALASIKTVAAFGELFNSAYWASRPYRGTEAHLSTACEALAEYLTKDDRAGVFRRLASRLRVDALKLHRLLALIPDDMPLENREYVRRSIGVLQAVRLALLQHMFIKAVSVPMFSRANDISRSDVLEMVFTLRVDDALAQLRRAFPTHFPKISDFAIDEPSDFPDDEDAGYGQIHRDYINPIDDAYQLCLSVGTAIANQFGAHG